MTLPIAFLDEARAEFNAAADWYDGQRPGMGTNFITNVQDVLDGIAAMPRMHQAIYKDVRRAVVKKFPYTVLYLVEPDQILVVAVFHSKRDPSIWQGRV
jgi:plasmid stabilization system protein ParE